jgi:hypothetical protein
MSSADALRRAAFEVKTIVARYPSLALPIARRRHGVPVGPSTELVIEGFPRSGTSFAVAAFRMAQRRPVEIACHVHAPAQIFAGVRHGLPVLAVVREPMDTVLSFVIRNPHVSIQQALRGYVRFYEPIARVRSGFAVGLFRDVTGDFGAVTAELNARFGTSFACFEHTDQSVAECFEQIDDDYRRRVDGMDFERSVARPSEHRRSLKRRLVSAYDDPVLAGLRNRAGKAFEVLAGNARAR